MASAALLLERCFRAQAARSLALWQSNRCQEPGWAGPSPTGSGESTPGVGKAGGENRDGTRSTHTWKGISLKNRSPPTSLEDPPPSRPQFRTAELIKRLSPKLPCNELAYCPRAPKRSYQPVTDEALYPFRTRRRNKRSPVFQTKGCHVLLEWPLPGQ